MTDEVTGDCIEWQRYRNKDGYGQRRVQGKVVPVHRAVWMETHGPIPDGMFVLHSCDNPPCYNIDHLFLGTKLDNARDRDRKRRRRPPTGEHNGRAILDWPAVREIRRLSGYRGPREALARRFGVSLGTIDDIRGGRTWRES